MAKSFCFVFVLLLTGGLAERVVCPSVEGYDTSTTLKTFDPVQRYTEISGLALTEELLYGVSDGGTGPRLGVWDIATGERLRSYIVPNTPNTDWEAMAVGPCGTKSCLFIADTGDNTARISEGRRMGRYEVPYRLIRIEEPGLQYEDNDTLPESSVSVIDFEYEDGFRDCEAMFLDTTGWGGDEYEAGDLYLVTKHNSAHTQHNRLYRVPVGTWESNGGSLHKAMIAGEADVYAAAATSEFLSNKWTRASMTSSGTLIALGSYSATHLFLRCPGQSVVDAVLKEPACLEWSNPIRGVQMETTAMGINGNIQIPEGNNPTMQWTTFSYDAPCEMCPLAKFTDAGECQDAEAGTNLPESWCVDGLELYKDEVARPPSPTPGASGSSPVIGAPAPTSSCRALVGQMPTSAFAQLILAIVCM